MATPPCDWPRRARRVSSALRRRRTEARRPTRESRPTRSERKFRAASRRRAKTIGGERRPLYWMEVSGRVRSDSLAARSLGPARQRNRLEYPRRVGGAALGRARAAARHVPARRRGRHAAPPRRSPDHAFRRARRGARRAAHAVRARLRGRHRARTRDRLRGVVPRGRLPRAAARRASRGRARAGLVGPPRGRGRHRRGDARHDGVHAALPILRGSPADRTRSRARARAVRGRGVAGEARGLSRVPVRPLLGRRGAAPHARLRLRAPVVSQRIRAARRRARARALARLSKPTAPRMPGSCAGIRVHRGSSACTATGWGSR